MRCAGHGSLGFFRIAQTFGEQDFNAAGGGVNAGADVFGERNQEFTGGRVDGEERRAGLRFARKENVTDGAEKSWGFGKRTGRRGKKGQSGWKFKDSAADEIGDEVLSGRKRYALLEGNLNFETAEFLGVVDRGDAFEMKNAETGMIAVDPKRLQLNRARSRLFISQKNFANFLQALGKIGEQFGRNFALVAAIPNDAGNCDEFRFGGIVQGGLLRSLNLREFRG